MQRLRGIGDASFALGVGVAAAIAVIEIANLFLVAGPEHHDVATVSLLIASALPIVFWRRAPFAVSLVIAAVTIALAVLDMPHLGLGMLAAVFAVALWAGPRARKASLCLLLVGVPVVPLLTNDASSIPKNIAFYAAAWIFGALLRERRAYTQVLEQRMQELEREREEKAALAAEAERTRIARELHDVLTHSVSVMVIQAQAAQAAAGDAEQVAGALTRIETVGKESLVELRRLLQRLRTDDDTPLHAPTPGLAQLDELLGEVRAAGLDVSARTRWRGPSTTSERRSLGVPDRAGGADEHAAPRGKRGHPDRAALPARRVHARGARRRPGGARGPGRGGAWSGGDARTGRARGRRRWSPRTSPVAASSSPRACPCRQGRDAAGAGRRRPGARARRLPHDPPGERHRGRGRGARRARGRVPRTAAAPGRRADGRAHAGHGRHRGHARARRARRRRPIAVLILTTFDLDEYVLEALRAGASGFLLKDAGRDQLVSARPDRRARATRCSRRRSRGG